MTFYRTKRENHDQNAPLMKSGPKIMDFAFVNMASKPVSLLPVYFEDNQLTFLCQL
jgi:hypothetical protein